MHDPDRYKIDPVVYLTLRSAYWRLAFAQRDQDLNGIYDLLWSAALRLEDGDLSLSENDLRHAREELKSALSKGASEIRNRAPARQSQQRVATLYECARGQIRHHEQG